MSPAPLSRRPLSTRPLDALYLTFFLIHIPIMLLVDLVPFYPSAVVPGFVTSLRRYYVETYRDRFFMEGMAPRWFWFYMGVEGVYGLPVSCWAGWAVWRDHPLVPLHLLIWAVQVGMTTATCVVDFMSWEGYTTKEKLGLAQLYVPYLALAALIGTDMFLRIKKQLLLPGGGPMRAEAVLIEKNK
ncbi:MAG: hypothetical protein Q9160_004297 [Pyrenula sp. 1 TL-2023]